MMMGVFLTGPGVGDMKTNVVMALTALRRLTANPLPGVGSITVLIVPDEEIGSPGSRAWIEGHARQNDVCLTLEPCRPGGRLVVGRGAVGALYIRATGVTSHVGAARALGASAISALAPLVGKLEALTDPVRGVGTSVGIFTGGKARQVVPGEAELHLDLRATDQAGADWLVAEARRIASAPPADARVTVSVEGGFYRPPFPTSAGTRHLYDMARAIGGAIGVEVDEIVSPGGCDGSFAAALGVPTLDGLGAICHEALQPPGACGIGQHRPANPAARRVDPGDRHGWTVPRGRIGVPYGGGRASRFTASPVRASHRAGPAGDTTRRSMA